MRHVLAATVVLALSAVARADWLAALPACAMDDALSTGPTRLVYPRPGLPAVLAPGESLVTRVRVAAPLTPPPGIQQERALRGWNAELVGHATLATRPSEWRYRLRVRDVRPDGQATLIYRATIRLPSYAAPGVYTLSVSAPGGGEATSVASVVVLERGATPRVARASAIPNVHDARADVFVVEAPSATLQAPVRGSGMPWLDASHRGVALFVGADLLTLGRCGDLDERAAALLGGGERRTVSQLTSLPDSNGAIEVDDMGVHNRTDARASIKLVVPEDGRATELDHDARWHPAVPVRPSGHLPSLVASVELAPGESLHVRRVPASGMARITAQSAAVAGQEARFEITTDGASAPIGVAWEWGEDHDAWNAGAGIEARFGEVERQEVHAMALDARGLPLRASLAVPVRPQVDAGCAAGGRPRAGILAVAWVLCIMGRPRYKGRGITRRGSKE